MLAKPGPLGLGFGILLGLRLNPLDGFVHGEAGLRKLRIAPLTGSWAARGWPMFPCRSSLR
jgi:hypothetical protein